MKRRIWPLFFLAVIAVFLLVWWARQPDGTPTERSHRAFSSSPPQVPAAARSGEPQPGEAAYPQYYLQQRRMDPLWEFSRPIEFFGKVVDELGSPVAGLRVEFSWKDLSSEGTSSTHSATDAFGRFSLTDVSGKVVTIRLDDSDYNVLWKTNQFAFEYANPFLPSFHTPNPDQPVIFHVLKKRESAPLISRRVKVRFSKNGEPTRVNLLTGMESSDGELEVRAWVQERDVRGRYDWKVSLRMTQGGFLETSEEFPSEAPSSGYDTAMEFSASASSPEWRPSLEKQFYFVVGSPPRFGRMKFSAKIYASGYYVDYFINPTGDRNLVYDPLRDVDLP